jgi:hypothetical protein
MQIRPAITYDPGLKTFSGYIDKWFMQDNGKSVATHLLVFMLRSLISDHKLIAAYYFTGNSTNCQMFRNTVQNVIKSVESFGKFKIHSVVNDMGPLNQSMWKSANIHSKRDSTSVSAIHPYDLSRKLFFIADPTHLIKNLRNLLLTHDIILPEQYIRQKNLQSNTVTLKCVEFRTSRKHAS